MSVLRTVLTALTALTALALGACKANNNTQQMDDFLGVQSGTSQSLSLTATAESRDFGLQSLKIASAEKRITVTNSSNVDIIVSSYSNTDSAFSIVSKTCPVHPAAFAAGTACEVRVVFAPKRSGKFSNLFTVIYGDSIDQATRYTGTLELIGQGESLVPFAGIDAVDQITATSARLRWTNPAGAQAFFVYQINATGGAIPIKTLAADATNVDLTGLTSASAYTFRVRVQDIDGGIDTNTNDKLVLTDSVGVFAAVATQITAEAQTVSVPLVCSDSSGHLPSFSIVMQNDSILGSGVGAGAGCSVSSGTLNCVVPYRRGHASWTATAEVHCSINGSILSRNIEFQIADTNRTPNIAAATNLTAIYPLNSSVIAGSTEVAKTFSLVSTSGDTNLGNVDEDGDSVNYTCFFESAATQGLLPGTFVQSCATLPAIAFAGVSNGAYAWTPRYQDGNTFFAFKITATEQGVTSPFSVDTFFRVFVNFAGDPLLTLSLSTLDFGNVGIGGQSLATVTVSNNALGIAELGAVTGSSPHFSIDSQTCASELLPGQTCTLTFKFAPTLPESQSANFTLGYGLVAGSFPFQLGISLNGSANPSSPTTWTQTTDTVTGGGGFQLNWIDQSTSESSFEIQRCTGPTCATTFTTSDSSDDVVLSSSNQSTYLWSGLTEGVVYRFRVRALRGALNSDWLTGPTQVFFKGITSITNSTGDSLRVSWTSATGANSYIITNTAGGSSVVVATITAPASTTTLTNLTPGTSFTLRVNLLRGDNIPDSNTKEIQGSTLSVVGAHLGWTEISAFGPRVSAAVVPVGDPIRAQEHTSYVKLQWTAMTVTNSTLQGYRIFRATQSGAQNFALPLAETNPGVRTYKDTTVTSGATYYYVVRPVAGSTAISTPEADSEVVVPVPPDNMTLIHRWLANNDTCSTMGRAVDRTHNYRCTFSGPASIVDTGVSYYDIGTSFFDDRFEAGCNYTSGSISKLAGVAPGAGVGNTGDVYYDRSNQYCYYKRAGNVWLRQDSATLTAAERAIMVSNRPGLPPLVNVTTQTAQNFCVARNTSTAEFKLPSIKKNLAASYWPISIWSFPGIAVMEQSHAGGNPVTVKYPLYDNSYCNANAGYGLTFENSDYPSDLTANIFGLVPSNIESIASSNVAGGAVRTGSVATKNCLSKYGIQDAIGNVSEWTSDQISKYVDGWGTAARGRVSIIDPSVSDLYDRSYADGAPSFAAGAFPSSWVSVPTGQVTSAGDAAAFDAVKLGTTAGMVIDFGFDYFSLVNYWGGNYSAAMGSDSTIQINGYGGRWSPTLPQPGTQSSNMGFRCISDRLGFAAQTLQLTQGNVGTPRNSSTCVSLTLKGLNSNGDAAIAGADKTITLSSSAAGGTFYSNAACSVNISYIDYAANQFIDTVIYYKDSATQTAALTASGTDLTSTTATLIIAAQTAPVLELNAATASSSGGAYASGCDYNSQTWWDAQSVNKIFAMYNTFKSKCASTTTGWRGTGIAVDPYRFAFNGTNHYMMTGLSVSPTEMPETTWEVWVQPQGLPAAGRTTILSADDSAYDRSLSIEATTQKICMTTGSVSASYWCPGVTATNATWQHVVVIWTAGNMFVYVNGAKSTRGIAPTAAVSVNPLTLGAKLVAGEYLNGSVGLVRVYNRAISDGDVCTGFNASRATYNVGASGACP